MQEIEIKKTKDMTDENIIKAIKRKVDILIAWISLFFMIYYIYINDITMSIFFGILYLIIKGELNK